MKFNWAGNLRYGAGDILYPVDVSQVEDLVRSHNKIKVVGGRHSFNRIADTDGLHLSLRNVQGIDIDLENRTVKVGAGVTYGTLATALNEAELAVPNLASLPHISVIGAISTATHGSGVNNGNLATSVSAMKIVTADGKLKSFSRAEHGDLFDGMVVNLGALGVVVEVELKAVSKFSVAQHVYQRVPHEQLAEHVNEIMKLAYSVSIFTDWQRLENNQIWVKRAGREISEPLASSLFGGTLETNNRHPIYGLDPKSCTEQLNEAGDWFERLPHFKMEFTPSAGVELQSEYFVLRENAPAALRALQAASPKFAEHVQITEVRAVKADNLWLSPAFGRDIIGIHFTWYQRDDKVREALTNIIEPILCKGFNAVPHWGKLFVAEPDRTQYPRFDRFVELVDALGARHKFANDFLEQYVLGKSS